MRIRKAVVFRASSLGDSLMGKYLLENVRAAYPDARVAFVVGSKGDMIRDFFEAYPWMEVIEASRKKPLGIMRVLTRFFWSDLVVTQYTGKGGAFSTMSKLMARVLAKPGGLIGFHDSWKWNKVIYSKLLDFSVDRATVEHDRNALRAAGVPILLPAPTYRFTPVEGVLEKFGLERGNYIALHLFSGGVKRGLSFDKKKELLYAVLQVAQLPVVLTAAPFEAAELAEIAEGLHEVQAVCDSPRELATVLSGASSVVSLDTGAAHIAAQIGKPLVVLGTCMGRPWWRKEQYPQNIPFFTRADLCTDGHKWVDHPACLNEVAMESVAAAVIY